MLKERQLQQPVLDLYQTEWCPASRRVRQRLTELGLPFVARPVPVERSERDELRGTAGTASIPAALLADGTVLAGEDAILAFLNETYDEPAGSNAHREKALKVRRRELEEALR